MSKRRLVIPAYLEVLLNGEQVFVPVAKCKDDPELMGQVINKALAELEHWRDKYGDLFVFFDYQPAKRIITVIDRLKQKMGDQWPTLPDELLAEEIPEDDDDED